MATATAATKSKHDPNAKNVILGQRGGKQKGMGKGNPRVQDCTQKYIIEMRNCIAYILTNDLKSMISSDEIDGKTRDILAGFEKLLKELQGCDIWAIKNRKYIVSTVGSLIMLLSANAFQSNKCLNVDLLRKLLVNRCGVDSSKLESFLFELGMIVKMDAVWYDKLEKQMAVYDAAVITLQNIEAKQSIYLPQSESTTIEDDDKEELAVADEKQVDLKKLGIEISKLANVISALDTSNEGLLNEFSKLCHTLNTAMNKNDKTGIYDAATDIIEQLSKKSSKTLLLGLQPNDTTKGIHHLNDFLLLLNEIICSNNGNNNNKDDSKSRMIRVSNKVCNLQSAMLHDASSMALEDSDTKESDNIINDNIDSIDKIEECGDLDESKAEQVDIDALERMWRLTRMLEKEIKLLNTRLFSDMRDGIEDTTAMGSPFALSQYFALQLTDVVAKIDEYNRCLKKNNNKKDGHTVAVACASIQGAFDSFGATWGIPQILNRMVSYLMEYTDIAQNHILSIFKKIAFLVHLFEQYINNNKSYVNDKAKRFTFKCVAQIVINLQNTVNEKHENENIFSKEKAKPNVKENENPFKNVFLNV